VFPRLHFNLQEWTNFIGKLYETIEQQLADEGFQSFSDLTDHERNLFLDRASEAIHDGTYYNY